MKNTLTTLLFLLIAMSTLWSQDCLTPESPDYLSLYPTRDRSGARDNLAFTVKVFVHIINEDDGSAGATPEQVYAEIDRLEAYYAPHDICFALVGVDQINDSEYGASPGDTLSPAQSDQLIIDYPSIPDVVDIYILPSNIFFRGTAYDIPNTYLLIYAGRFNTPHLAHEMGHCLGLYHTHATSFGDELVDGSNCAGAGDLLCDTPADPGLSGNVDDVSCNYTGTDTDANDDVYNPDVTNTMSYAPFGCRGLFTQDQEDRMHDILSSNFTVVNDILVDDTALALCCETVNSGVRIETSLDFITATDFEITNGAVVRFIAEDYIHLSPSFEATPTGNGYFLAQINIFCDGDYPTVNSGLAPSPRPRVLDQSNHLSHSLAGLSVFPNPANDHIMIACELPVGTQLDTYIHNQYGQVVLKIGEQKTADAGRYEQQISVADLVPGLYYVVLKGNGINEVKPFVVVQ